MKLKSNSSAKKRFKKTGTGKIVGKKAARGHLLMQKSRTQKRLGIGMKILEKGNARAVARALPNL